MKELFLRCKGILEAMPRINHFEAFTFARIKKPYWADETVWLNICFNDEIIGDVALLSKKAAMECSIKNLSVILFELNLDKFSPLTSRTNEFTHIAEYPTIEYDLALLFDSETKWETIKATALKKKNNESFLKDVAFVDEYTGKQVPEGKKSVTLRLIIGSDVKTLTSSEIENCANSVIKILAKELGGDMRQK